jgi:acyl carrier protein
MNNKPDATHETIAAIMRDVDEDLKSVTAAGIRGKSLTTDLGLDSLDIIKFILLVEEKFGFKIPDHEIDAHSLLAVDNLVSYLAKRNRA